MQTPTADIIVPVWNNPFETRACLAAILEHSPRARLIIVDYGSSRETELMLEEFSEPLGERGLFIFTDRNVGLVRAVNIGLARSDSAYAVIVRPNVIVCSGWLERLLKEAVPSVGIVSPLFSGMAVQGPPRLTEGCTSMETGDVSFNTLLVRGEAHMLLGGFDEQMDGGEWCLKDYVRRAWSRGYRTVATNRVQLACGGETLFGSGERRRALDESSRALYRQRWEESRCHGVYFTPDAEPAVLERAVEVVLEGARRGHRFTLFLHRRQAQEFRRRGWSGLHTGIELSPLPLLLPLRALARRVRDLRERVPGLVMVRGVEGGLFPEVESAVSLEELSSGAGAMPDRPREIISEDMHGDH